MDDTEDQAQEQESQESPEQVVAIPAATFPNDNFGRTVEWGTDGVNDIYTVTDSSGNQFTQNFPIGTPLDQVYGNINGVQPRG